MIFFHKSHFLFPSFFGKKPSSVSIGALKKRQENLKLNLPGSKSFTNRAIVLSALSNQKTSLSHFLFSDDSWWGLSSLVNLGFDVRCFFEEERVEISKNLQTCKNNSHCVYIGSSGTLARFLPAVILNWNKTFLGNEKSCLLTTSPQLKKRPISELCVALKNLNANINTDGFPLMILSSNLQGFCQISGQTSGQFLSGLLIAATGSKNKIQIQRTNALVQPGYVHMTLKILEAFGAEITCTKNLEHFEVFQKKSLFCDHYSIESDASTACYFIAAAFLHNFPLTIENLGSKSLQPDIKFIEFLTRMGALIACREDCIEIYQRKETIILGGFSVDFSQYSDQALTAGILALFANAPIEVTGVQHIRGHESDRIACFVKNAVMLGFSVEEKKDGFLVLPVRKDFIPLHTVWHTHEDHRFAMAGFLLASKFETIAIENPSCVEKTAPKFFEYGSQLGFEVIFKE